MADADVATTSGPSDREASAVLWFRRDLRLRDHPALAAAAALGPVTALFVLDQALLQGAGAPRTAYLYRTLRALDADLRSHGGALTVVRGMPEEVVPALAAKIGAGSVHVSADFAPYGAKRDDRVAAALGEVPLVRTGSPYAVAPTRVTKDDGSPYRVFTPFYRAWLAQGWPAPAQSEPGAASWRVVDAEAIPEDPPHGVDLPEAGERGARAAWDRFLQDGHVCRRTEPSRPGRDLSYVALPQVRRDSPEDPVGGHRAWG
jgi:deoxyribodipyrimidine photo-lyase